MKLRIDQNLSHRLVAALADVCPACEHFRNIGLKEAADTVVWNYARSHGFVIGQLESE